MELEVFKKLIESKSFNSNLLIANCIGNGEFIFDQYVNQYAQDHNLTVEVIDDLSQVNYSTGLFTDTSSTVKVLKVDTLDYIKMPVNDILWVKTKKVTSNIQKEFPEHTVKIPKLEMWQIKDYIMSLYPDLSEKDVDYIIAVYKDNIYRIDMEISKLEGFKDLKVTYPIIKDQLFTDSIEYNIFDLVNAVVQHDVSKITLLLKNINKIDVNPFAFITSLQNNFKRVIDVQLNPRNTAESLGMNSKQFYAIKKYSCNHYTKDQLCKIYHFINDCEYKMKMGKLDTSIATNYMISKIMNM